MYVKLLWDDTVKGICVVCKNGWDLAPDPSMSLKRARPPPPLVNKTPSPFLNPGSASALFANCLVLSCTCPGALTAKEITAAELLWLLHAQGALARQKDFDSLKYELGLFLDDKGLWRCGGCLQM